MKLQVRAGASATFTCVTLLTLPTTVQAHSPIEGLGTFYSHLLHPVLVPSHALLLIAASLMLGQQGRSGARAGIVALGMAFAVGMLTSTAGAFGSVREHALLLGALALGALISLDLRIPSALTVAAGAAAGLATGLDSSINNPGPRDTALAFAGVIIGVMYLTILVAGATVGLVEHWHRVGVRIVGSWIVAMALMVLALSVATPVKRATATIASPTALASPC